MEKNINFPAWLCPMSEAAAGSTGVLSMLRGTGRSRVEQAEPPHTASHRTVLPAGDSPALAARAPGRQGEQGGLDALQCS